MTRQLNKSQISIRGAQQNNLRDLDLDIPLHQLVVVTGVSGSGKSSLAFDTVYAEGQRRYVETFSPYARQFLERMDRPRVERIEGIPPAIAIDQTNPVRTSRSTVGTMTELNDHLKLLFARVGSLFCAGCGREVKRDSPESVATELLAGVFADQRVLICFPVRVPAAYPESEIRAVLAEQGYTRFHELPDGCLHVVQDRLRLGGARRDRLVEAVEVAFDRGKGLAEIFVVADTRVARFSNDLHCPDCDSHYRDPTPGQFSFNSPVGACATCRGFGRVMGIDYELVVPDTNLSLAGGAIRPWQSKSYQECQQDLLRFARRRGIPIERPWSALSEWQREWVIAGEGGWDEGVWYGARRFFEWLESRAYKMHVRVLLSRYRSYSECPSCAGARLQDEALHWRVGDLASADLVLDPARRFRPRCCSMAASRFATLPGLNVHDVMSLPLQRCGLFFDHLAAGERVDKATELLLDEIRSRLRFLNEVGLGYLTLDRQSRTLSGGEVQRINLTTALGTSLVNTLFVLDEPSIGLHPRDMGRVISILQRLRDSGNSLLVVEHDPQLMQAADRIIDMGPGPGEHGGEVVFFGTPQALKACRYSLTADYLAGRKQLFASDVDTASVGDQQFLTVRGARARNLRDLEIRIPLRRLVCLTGVSGSGKSTLMVEVLYRGLRRLYGHPTEAPGEHEQILGFDAVEDVVLVDQSAIGKTTRSNPASYVGALSALRALFANQPLAKERGYKAGMFSFNSGAGRCPGCGGNGFEHLEMQFLSDVYLRCPECDGRRYRDEVLEVRYFDADGVGRSIADVLEMTAHDAIETFADHPEVLRGLEPLAEVGLGYLRLGQPVPTLSGGEAQRLKLAGQLAKTGRDARRPKLFLFDEPTTGLHFEDIAKLLSAFRALIEQGHSVLVIEHNLDVIAAANWVIDLGPEGGDGGGELVFAGDRDALLGCEASHTGQCLREYLNGLSTAARTATTADPPGDPPVKGNATRSVPAAIRIRNAREHNLCSIDLDLPQNRFTVITGISGSGKSTVAFDILFAEGQRRYLESLNAYARQFVQPAARPDVDALHGIPPTVAIEQRTSRGGRKSTVATMSEVYQFLRLLYVKLGVQHCPDCDIEIRPQTRELAYERIMRRFRGRTARIFAPLVMARKGYYTELALWAQNKGFESLRVDGTLLPTADWPRLDRYREHDIDLPVGEQRVGPEHSEVLGHLLGRALEFGKGTVRVEAEGEEELYSTERACPGCGRSFPVLDPRLFSFNSRHGWCPQCLGTGLELPDFDEEQTGEEEQWQNLEDAGPCSACAGSRLRPEALAVRFKGHSLADLTGRPVVDAKRLLDRLQLSDWQAEIARDVIKETGSRLEFLVQVGLGYLRLDRSAPTLSGGEAQRIRLAAQLGSNLRGVCYVLDEPTIGLHPKDNRLLLDTLQELRDKGNTVVVVEHDEETIRRAEHLVDLGPGAGVNGGRVVAQGSVQALIDAPESVTGRALAQPLQHPLFERRPVELDRRRKSDHGLIQIRGASQHNLRGFDMRLPLQRLVCVTGVSGSGKSTLVRHVLYSNLKRLLATGASSSFPPVGCRAISGWEGIRRVVEVDQSPIGKTPRSCPATYIGIWDAIRKLYAATPEARLRGYTGARFSFNVRGGRCESCEGQGVRRIGMSFLPDVKVPCESCKGTRFGAETLAISYRGRNIGEILAMSVEDAVGFFTNHPRVHRALALLSDVGLGYLTLGQPSPTLSGGEAQRIKLVAELAGAKSTALDGGGNLYVLDEPTVGLHMADVERLLGVLHRLVEAGHSVVVIEHNLDVVAEADWIVDLGPDGGDAGGRVVARGTPESLTTTAGNSHTAEVLTEFLNSRRA